MSNTPSSNDSQTSNNFATRGFAPEPDRTSLEDSTAGFLAHFKPSRRLIQQIERDLRGISRERMPNVIL